MRRALIPAILGAFLGLPASACSSGGGGGGTTQPTHDCGNGNRIRVVQPCAGCASSTCPSETGACLGSGWASAQFSGLCMPLINCLCTCSDQLCADMCIQQAPKDCQDCLSGMGSCLSAKCPNECPNLPFGIPSTGSGGSGASSGSGGSGGVGTGGLGSGGLGSGGLAGFGGGLGGLGGLGGGPACLPPEFPCFDAPECCSGVCAGGFCQ